MSDVEALEVVLGRPVRACEERRLREPHGLGAAQPVHRPVVRHPGQGAGFTEGLHLPAHHLGVEVAVVGVPELDGEAVFVEVLDV